MYEVISIDAFANVKAAGHYRIYDYLERAMKYYESDPEQSCMNFRSVLKLTIVEAERITCFVTQGGLQRKITTLNKYLLERELIDGPMIREIEVVKRKSDKWMHKEDYPDLDPIKDEKTFFYAFKAIFKWLVNLPKTYAAFIHKREEEQARLKAERERLENEAKERAEAEQKKLEELRKLQEAEKEAKRRLRKIKWQKGVEKTKKLLPWLGYGAVVAMCGIAVGAGVIAINEHLKKSSEGLSSDVPIPETNPESQL